jgi:DinB superfamily
MTGIGEPGPGEYAPFYEGYVARVRGSNIVTTLEEQAGTVAEALARVAEEREGFRYAEGKWSVREVVGHWTDAERVFSYRALAFARGERAALPAFDENEFARTSNHDAISLGELAAEFQSVRAATLHLLHHLPGEAWRRGGTASGKPVTVRALAFIMGGHVAHHLAMLRERYGVGE